MSAPEAADAFVAAWREDQPGVRDHQLRQRRHGRPHRRDPGCRQRDRDGRRLPGQVVRAVHASGGTLLITADHGNADNMLEPDGSPNTAHSLNPVPVIVTMPGLTLREGGVLADVAPTILQLLGYEQPQAMTGVSLIS